MKMYTIRGVMRALGAIALCLSTHAAIVLGAGVRVVEVVGRSEPIQVNGAPATSLTLSRVDSPKSATGGKGAAVTGDNVSDPFVVASLPFNDAQSTAGYTDDYNEVCPFPESGAPDVVYSYTPSVGEAIRIDLCGSTYDTRVYVYENTVTSGSPYACNDDYCGSSWYRSRIPSLAVTTGNTYYIVVDGWGTAAGSYQLSITTDEACSWSGCSPGATAEGEVCATGTDVTNGGCNLASQLFSALEFAAPVCGQIWAELPNRDTDWYRKSLTAGQPVRWKARAEFPVSIFVFDLSPGCDSISGLRLDGDPCEDIAITFTPESTADFAFVVTTREQYGGYECGSGPGEYEATLELACGCQCHADPAEIPAPDYCNGIINIQDVVAVVNVAFRGTDPSPDPVSTCPVQRADVNCTGFVNIQDVVAVVNVAFRGAVPAEMFCDPCAP